MNFSLVDSGIPCRSFRAVIVGSGAAGYNAARKLYDLGVHDIAIITEGEKMGTSRNTGSDKQTYYKLTLAGGDGDSVSDMAETLFSGGAMHGDIALAQAAGSARCFFELVSLGVPFPHNEYGEYAGYKTDHDPRMRATSCGPYTSKYITEALERAVKSKNIPIFDGYRAVKILRGGGRACGIVALCPALINEKNRYGMAVFLADNVIWATGGPSAIYSESVYPESQTCAHGMAFEAGAAGINLTESQYGIASLGFRWNLSGTYQQVIPRYFSIDENGNEHEFLTDYFPDMGEMLGAIFSKGYEWPFDPRKIFRGGRRLSSLIDLAVFSEKCRGRRVFMDFRRNPAASEHGGSLDFSLLPDYARKYLEKSGALLPLPIDRLRKMNEPAVSLYREHGIDITLEPLEIAVCAQHNNGGLDADIWSESTALAGFFPIGECAGTFGVYRPGGTALNATQVSSMRAAEKIAGSAPVTKPDESETSRDIADMISFFDILSRPRIRLPREEIFARRKEYGRIMSECGAFVRSPAAVSSAISSVRSCIRSFEADYAGAAPALMPEVMINRDILITALVYLGAIEDYIAHGGKSRGSYLVTERSIDELIAEGRDIETDEEHFSQVQTALYSGGEMKYAFSPVRPIPERELWFENVYNEYRKSSVKTPLSHK